MAELKREYVVPLRRKCLTAPKWRRSKKAIAVLKDFMRKHMKCENVIVCAELNEYIWRRGAKNPPGKVEVVALKTQVNQDQKVLVNLKGFGIDEQKAMYNTQDTTPQEEESVKNEVVDAEVKESTEEETTENTVTEEKTTVEETTKTTKKIKKTVNTEQSEVASTGGNKK